MTAKKLKLKQDATSITLMRINQAGEPTANDKLYFDAKDFVTVGRFPGSVKTVLIKIVDDRTLAVYIVTKLEANGKATIRTRWERHLDAVRRWQDPND